MNVSIWSKWLTGLRSLGPYILIELLLPGGTLIALCLWFTQRAIRGGDSDAQISGAAPELPQGAPEPQALAAPAASS
jgi:hypothetical protein